jgi:hypothetical protein
MGSYLGQLDDMQQAALPGSLGPGRAQRHGIPARLARIGATTVEVPGSSHSVYVPQPAAVAGLIKQAAR